MTEPTWLPAARRLADLWGRNAPEDIVVVLDWPEVDDVHLGRPRRLGSRDVLLRPGDNPGYPDLREVPDLRRWDNAGILLGEVMKRGHGAGGVTVPAATDAPEVGCLLAERLIGLLEVGR